MLTQLKLALRILQRRKFFTFISLFGISMTIMALVVIAALGDAALGNNPPLSKRDRLVFATQILTQRMIPDTSYVVDSALVNDRMVYDSTEQIGERQEGNANGGISNYIYTNYLGDLEGVETSTHSNPTPTFDAYIDGRKVTFAANFTDAHYWNIFDFRFVAGAPYSDQQVISADKVAVISTKAALAYYGVANESVLGRNLELADDNYRVVGVVDKPSTTFLGLDSDVFIPNTTSKFDLFRPSYLGGGGVVFLLQPGIDRKTVIAEISKASSEIRTLPGDDANRFTIEGLTFFEEVANDYVYSEESRDQSFTAVTPLILTLLSMLLLLPALNLININLSRVYERASEIAVRKSFGATDAQILRQFLAETFTVTVFGSVLGVGLAGGLIALINHEGWLGNVRLAFTSQVAVITICLVLVLTLLTGLLPSLRLSRSPITTSLR